MISGLAYGVAAWPWAVIFTMVFLQWWSALVLSLGTALLVALVGAASVTPPVPSQLHRPRRQSLTRGLKAGLRPGLVLGLALAFVALVLLVPTWLEGTLEETLEGMVSDLLTVLETGLSGGLLVAVAFGLTAAFSGQQRDAVSPLSAFKTDVRAVPLVGLLTGIVVGLAMGFVTAPLIILSPPDPLDGVVTLWTLAATISVVVGVAAGSATLWFALRRSAAPQYGLAVFLLAQRGVVPRRPLRFLEDAYERGVMRHAGMKYEFRHARLAERLASHGSSAGMKDG